MKRWREAQWIRFRPTRTNAIKGPPQRADSFNEILNFGGLGGPSHEHGFEPQCQAFESYRQSCDDARPEAERHFD